MSTALTHDPIHAAHMHMLDLATPAMVEVAAEIGRKAATALADQRAGLEAYLALSPAQQYGISYHEAGHAVACLALGVPFDSVSVTPKASEYCLGICRTGGKALHDPGIELQILLAGGVAAELYTGQRDHAIEATDQEQVHRLLAAHWPEGSRKEHTAFLAQTRAGVKSLLQSRWHEVEAIADDLLHLGELSYDVASTTVLAVQTRDMLTAYQALVAHRRAR